MSAKQNKPTRGREPGKPPPLPDAKIPREPPMAVRTLSPWPLIIAVGAVVLWLVWLAILMHNSARWRGD